MLKTLILVGFTTIFTAVPALAENWVFVARDKGGTDYYIDTESVQANNPSTYLLWNMSVSPEPDSQGIVATKTYVSMSCPLRGWRRLIYAKFNAQGELVNREDLGENEPLEFFSTGSVGEGLWKFVCK